MTWSIERCVESAERVRAAQMRLQHDKRIEALRKAGQTGQLASSWSRIRMHVSPWTRDEFGNQTRTVRQAD